MKRKYLKVSMITISFALISILFSNCSKNFLLNSVNAKVEGGTGVGNPLTPVTSKLMTSACAVISKCHPEISQSACEKSLSETSGLDYQIGLPTGVYSSFKTVMAAEEQGQLVFSPEKLNSCADIVSNLSCDSPQVQGAVIAEQGDSFWGSPRLFMHEMCAGVLTASAVTSTKFHYVRAGATGTGDGSDWQNACPDFVGECDGSNLQRGHTYYVASGDYSGVTFDVPGTELITVKKATDTDHGTDSGWNSSMSSGPAVFPYWTFRSSHWVIDGQSRTSLETGHGFQINPPRLNPDCAVNFCNAILAESDSVVDRITLRYVEVVGFGVNAKRHLNGFYSVPINGSSSNIVLYGMSMHDFSNYNGNSPLKTSGNEVVNLTFDNSAIIRSAALAVSDTGSENVTFRNNWFENVSDQGVIVVSTTGDSKNWLIHGNVFWESDPANYGVFEATIQCEGYGNGNGNCINWQIANNTFAGFTSDRSKYSGIRMYLAGPLSTGNRVVNNIWYNTNNPDVGGGNLVSDYNMYLSSTNAPIEPSGVIGDYNPFVNSASGDFHLNAPTAKGLTLPAPLNLGRDGKIRGADGNWDRGAFEF
ncbi:MAG: hypothetical protein ACXVCP_17650 [Bdellovibrio sp.]